MTKVHRTLLNTLDEVRAINLDTPYGFQENLDQMSEKNLAYFDTSLQLDMRTVSFPSFAHAPEDTRATVRSAVTNATYVFAGPGSPTYALDQWQPLHLEKDLATVLRQGGVVCFSSAAALTLGAFTPPIYEIYKAGAPLSWREGLNLTAIAGLDCVVLPHYNNAEGGTYDTSRCYLSERRLRLLEELLPATTSVLGVDEHTAALIDLETRTLRVAGKGAVHWRCAGAVTSFEKGASVSLDDLDADAVALEALPTPEVATTSTLSADELAENEARDQALVMALDEIRLKARARSDYETADEIRAALNAFGVVVRDGATKA